MKVLGLDPGDVWIGVAISDALGISCRPLSTITLDELETFLTTILSKEAIDTIVVGYPLTMKGLQSDQTKKIILLKEALEKKFTKAHWLLWDERLSSKRAQTTQTSGAQSKEARHKEHAIAAAFILQGYLDWRDQQQERE